MKKETFNSLLSFILLVIVFLFLSYVVNQNGAFLQRYLSNSWKGMVIFVLLVASSIVLAPVSVLPMFPIATGIWGIFTSSVLGIIGWLIGAVTAFYLARRFGVSLVSRFIPLSTILKYQDKIPQDHLFLSVVILRMVFPVDGVSYFFGLFSKMKLSNFAFATFIGLIPFSFMIAYLGSIPFRYQLIVILVPVIAYSTAYLIKEFRDEKNKKKDTKKDKNKAVNKKGETKKDKNKAVNKKKDTKKDKIKTMNKAQKKKKSSKTDTK